MLNARTATARDFDAAARRNAVAFWVWAVVALVIGALWRWWAAIPGGLAVLMVMQSIGAARAAGQLREGTFSIPNPNNGLPERDSTTVPAAISDAGEEPTAPRQRP